MILKWCLEGKPSTGFFLIEVTIRLQPFESNRTNTNPIQAKRLLAEAGYPDKEGPFHDDDLFHPILDSLHRIFYLCTLDCKSRSSSSHLPGG